MCAVEGPHPKDFYEVAYQAEGCYATSMTDITIYQRRIRELLPYVRFDGLILEIGCGKGLMSKVGSSYIGIDISEEALKGNAFKCVVASAESLPFPDGAFTCIFSYHTLEHIQYPELALSEIDRVLSPSGTVFLKPAWNCRTWSNRKLIKKPYSILPIRDKIEKALIPVLNSLVLRGLATIPKRILKDLYYTFIKNPTDLKYRRLHPDYVYDEYWSSDADAAVSIDPCDVIWFFKSKGYTIPSHPSFLRRIFARSEGVVAQRNHSHG